MEYKFKTETIHDLTIEKEFQEGFRWSQKGISITYLLLSFLLIWQISLFEITSTAIVFLIIAAVYLVCYLVTRKRGSIGYRRMVSANGGKPHHTIIQIGDDGILLINRDNDNKNSYNYDQFKAMVETKNLLILVMPYKLCLIMQKAWLIGGTSEDLKAYLFEKCPNIKKKKPRDIRFGKWVQYFHITVLVIGTILALTNLPAVSLWDRISGKLHNDLTYQEMAAQLEPLGITISPQTIVELEAYDAEYAPGENYYDVYYYESKVLDLLYWEGSGIYNQETWEWTPSSSGVFWFDAEVWNVDTIYTDFFTGVSAMDEELTFTNVQEDYSRVDFEQGTGVVTVTFDYNGNSYELDADFYYDWFDEAFLFDIQKILADDEKIQNLYIAEDGGQGYVLYYGAPEMIRQLELKTGLAFYDSSTIPGY